MTSCQLLQMSRWPSLLVSTAYALKLLGMHRAVNVTLGLPIVRTSVAHGTAFDLAWRGIAETSSMLEAIRVASLLASGRPNVDLRFKI